MMLRLITALLVLALPAQAEMTIKEVTSPGGITAWLVEDHNIPFTALEIQFRGGTSLDAPEKRGAVNLMTGLLEEGADDMDSRAFAEARDSLAAEFTFDPGTDSVGVSARFLTENRDQAVTLLRSALVNPRFDQDAVDRVRGQVLAGLRSDSKDPDRIAPEIFDRLAFGDHPYASNGDGTVDTVTALTRDDIIAAHKGALARDRIYVAAAGDITADQLGTLLDTLLGDLPATGAAQPADAPYLLKPGVTVQDFPTPQSTVYFGHQGITRDDPDFFAAFVLNEVLGGGRFSARLMTEVRDKRGLTYGVGSYLVPMDHAELVLGQFSTSNDKVAEAIEVTRAEWAKIATEGITEDELANTKTYLTGSYPLRFDGNGRIANILVGMQMEGLPIDYAVTRNAKIEAVTLEDAKRVAARLFQPDALHFVVVGQPVGVTSTP
ncbi:MAG: pitrilysin family protein [Tabrizicola sp.]|uniref:M16 family metallopeptidase n=1 Tax=Tabrizicola sp. TaxID=2005166 RepID=UPI002734A979|nr:pitrilysin family protein [Tabrizicola sp.]MDP3262234.1 pitrilysin family protein [Tabrizicola sp.]MDP3648019.1 pitrilysin family protein [Paracoccaceae bacterium]MDZ4068649.1 pitrilysin family protein [Tabrizicola sp.]